MTEIYGNIHGLVALMIRAFDPAYFFLFWVALFWNQVWFEVIDVS